MALDSAAEIGGAIVAAAAPARAAEGAQAPGALGIGLTGSAGHAVRPDGTVAAPKSIGSDPPLEQLAPGPESGHCLEPDGTMTRATAGWAAGAGVAVAPMPWTSAAAMRGLTVAAWVGPGAHPVAAASATIWVATETSASRTTAAERF